MDDTNKTLVAIVAIAVIVALVVAGFWAISTNNKIVEEEEAIDSNWAQVSNQYQRKVDLIPELVTIVSNYQEFESSTLSNITALRSQWMDADTTEEQVNASNALDQELMSIVLTFEAYPYLQSVFVVSDLMVSLESTEDMIMVARMRYNEAVQDYNTHIKKFPANMIAEMGDYEERSYYSSTAGPEAP